MKRKEKGWAIVTKRGLLVGGGSKFYGYTPLCVYRTREGAKDGCTPGRTDKVVRCEILLDTK